MKGPIVGIIAVFFLQLGVIGYGTAARFFDAPVEVGSIISVPDPLPSISDADFNEFEPDVVISTDTSNPEYIAPTYANSVRRSFAASKRSNFRTFDTDFKAVTINVPKPSPFAFAAYEPSSPRTEFPIAQASDREPKYYEASSKTIDVRRKRGFLSKTLGVIKKPYDWTRTLVSKLK